MLQSHLRNHSALQHVFHLAHMLHTSIGLQDCDAGKYANMQTKHAALHLDPRSVCIAVGRCLAQLRLQRVRPADMQHSSSSPHVCLTQPHCAGLPAASYTAGAHHDAHLRLGSAGTAAGVHGRAWRTRLCSSGSAWALGSCRALCA